MIITGAGVIGMMLARLLLQHGQSVRIFDQREAGKESSWAGGGIVSPLYPWRHPEAVNRLARWSQQRYPSLAEELTSETGVDPEYIPCGLLITDETKDASIEPWLQRESVPHQWMSPGEVNSVASEIAPRPTSLWLPEIGQIRNPRLTRALRESVRATPGVLAEHTPVLELMLESGTAVGVRTKQDTYTANHIVLTAGAWTGMFLESHGHGVPIKPVRGQMIVFDATPSFLHPIVLSDGFYLIPRNDGRILAGSTVEHEGFVKQTTDAARETLREKALALCPALSRAPIISHWAGLRPGSPNGVPVIGPHPEIEGLWINAGHFRNGLTLAPASAEVMKNLLCNEEPIVPLEDYTVAQARSSCKPEAEGVTNG